MKKVLFLFFLFFFSWTLKVEAFEIDINSSNAILYNLNTHEIYFEKGKDEIVSIASLTKVMTALLFLENTESLEEQVTIESIDLKGLIEENASVAGFKIGDVVTKKDLLYGLLLPSGADAAQAIARIVSRNVESFVVKMNDKAKELGLTKTSFANPTGFDAEKNYSTVSEYAVIFETALKNPDLKEAQRPKIM